MSSFIKHFVGDSTAELCDEANEYAKANKLEIVTANFSFSGAGKIFERPVLTVVYDTSKPKRARKKADGKEEESDE